MPDWWVRTLINLQPGVALDETVTSYYYISRFLKRGHTFGRAFGHGCPSSFRQAFQRDPKREIKRDQKRDKKNGIKSVILYSVLKITHCLFRDVL
jgi:hypothetical protein